MLEQAQENAGNGHLNPVARTPVPAGLCAEDTTGPRLDAGRAADAQWREEQSRRLIGKLRLAHRLDASGRGACVIAGLIGIPLMASYTMGEALFKPVFDSLFAVLIGDGLLLAAGDALGLAGALLNRWQMARVLSGCIGMPALPRLAPDPSGKLKVIALDERPAGTNCLQRLLTTYVAVASEGCQTDFDRESSALQGKLFEAHAARRDGSSLCLVVGYCVLALVPLALPGLLVITPQRIFEQDTLAKLLLVAGVVLGLPVGILLVLLPIAALIACSGWLRFRKLLREAERKGLEVSDPARFPWD